ncbi:serine hydrolase domain-containing protein, partial [Gemmatimonadota bacterium]
MSARLHPSVRASALTPRVRLVSLWLALVLCGTTPTAAQESTWDSLIADFSARIAEDVATDGVGGITAGIVVGTDPLWGRGFGFADRERHIPATVNTIYRVGSVSKSFTAVAMMQAAERGLLALDDPVVEVLPALSGLADRPEGAVPITFRHLGSHTSGLVREPELERAAYGPLNEWEDKILASIPTTSFFERPGVQYQYSNIGYGILGLATSRAAGVPFMDLVMEGIVETLGMTSTFFALTPETWPHMAKGYANRRFGPVDPENPPGEDDLVNTEDPFREHSGRGYKVPNGGVYSTIADLGLFIAGMTGAA